MEAGRVQWVAGLSCRSKVLKSVNLSRPHELTMIIMLINLYSF